MGSTLPSERSHRVPLPAPILIVDQDSPILHHALKDDFPGLTFDLCASLDQAEQNLQTKRYQALVTNVRLAAMQDFSLLKWNQAEHPATPFIITMQCDQKALAYQALEQGALDCILKPVNRAEAVPTMQSALSLHQFRVTIAHRKQFLKGLEERRAALSLDTPDQIERAKLLDQRIMTAQDTISAYRRTISAIEQSLKYWNHTTNDLEQIIRHRAVGRLGAMHN